MTNMTNYLSDHSESLSNNRHCSFNKRGGSAKLNANANEFIPIDLNQLGSN